MGKHRQLALSIAACALGAVLAASAQTPKPLLPEKLGSAQRLNWKAVEPTALESVAGDLAPILREYGAQRGEQADYQLGTRRARLLVHTLPDRSSAYGAFTLLRGKAPEIALGEGGARLPDGLVFYQGNHLVVIEGASAAEPWRPLAQSLAERSPDQASLPMLPLYLPEEGLVAGSDAYVLGPLGLSRVAPLGQGDWVGFAYGAEVEAARYRLGQRDATLLLVSYPTPHIARARLGDFQRLFNLNGTGGAGALVFARRKSTLVVLVQGLESAEEAGKLMDGVRYQPELSWSEPTPISDAEMVSGLLGLFLGTGLIVVLTVGLGLAFGLARLLLLRTMPGQVFDKPVENDSIFLNLQNPK